MISLLLSQWDMAFSVNPSTVSTNSPPMNMSNTTQPMGNMVNQQYPIQYDSPSRTVPPTQSVSPPQFQAPPVVFSARDWQQSVASVFDPQGLKRRWNYSVDMTSDNMSKRQRGWESFHISIFLSFFTIIISKISSAIQPSSFPFITMEFWSCVHIYTFIRHRIIRCAVLWIYENDGYIKVMWRFILSKIPAINLAGVEVMDLKYPLFKHPCISWTEQNMLFFSLNVSSVKRRDIGSFSTFPGFSNIV